MNGQSHSEQLHSEQLLSEQLHRSQWLDDVASAMYRAGLPSGYVSRTLVELADHVCEQSLTEGSSSDDVEAEHPPASQLANEFIHSYRFGRWYRRIPSWMWVLFSFPFSLSVCVAYYLVGVLFMGGFNDGFDPHQATPLFVYSFVALFASGKVLTPLIATALLAFAISKAGRPRWVFHVVTVLLAFFFLFTSTDVVVPNRFVGASLEITISEDWMLDPRTWTGQAMQMTVVLGTSLAFWLRNRRDYVTR